MTRNVLFVVCLFVYSISNAFAQSEQETFTDKRDGKIYKTISIGNQVWMAENLAYKANSGCWAYDDSNDNVSKYGYLYNFEAANNVCPSGYRLPSDDDWELLSLTINNQNGPFTKTEDAWEGIGNLLKAKSGWFNNANGTDYFGFNALPGGCHKSVGSPYVGKGIFGEWWTGTTKRKSDAWVRGLYFHTSEFGREYKDKNFGYSVRCIKE